MEIKDDTNGKHKKRELVFSGSRLNLFSKRELKKGKSFS